ncbi:hypothetical protein NPIL_663171 [Nephila pilipes]|uniref:Uncharacterized protein n=1 Tax=Nephila pilipes TaxID=299642 RepID=A0A8X6UFW2_NEPPI|nr:hypothetical protein NPIL_663171 [Nephila pilipes]
MQEVLSSSDKEMRPAKDSSLFVFVHPCDGGGGIECPVSIEDFTVYRIPLLPPWSMELDLIARIGYHCYRRDPLWKMSTALVFVKSG